MGGGLEVKLQQLMKHLEIVNDKSLVVLASKVSLCVQRVHSIVL